MRVSLITLCATLFGLGTAGAQDFSYRRPEPPRGWLVLGDAIAATGGGGLNNTNGVVQILRASATVRLTDDKGFEVSAMRFQEVFPVVKLVNDRELNDPEGDALTLAFASLNRDGSSEGFPASAVIGGGVVRRPTNDPTKTRLTGALMGGFESNLHNSPFNWADFTAGLRLILMPAGHSHEVYIIGVTGGIRIG